MGEQHKARKVGRNKIKCANYRARFRREKNKERKIKKHLKRHPADAVAGEALKRVWKQA